MNKTINDNTISFKIVPYTPKIRFLASLSDGRTVIQENRPNEKHSWIRLSKWLKNNQDIKITGLRLQGPNGIDKKMPANQDGYFFTNKQVGVWGGPQHNYIGIGYYDGEKIIIAWYRQPKFDHSFTEERLPKDSGFGFIENIECEQENS